MQRAQSLQPRRGEKVGGGVTVAEEKQRLYACYTRPDIHSSRERETDIHVRFSFGLVSSYTILILLTL